MKNYIDVRTIGVLLSLQFLCLPLHAESVYRDTCYSLYADIGCAYNMVYGHHGLANMGAMLPINRNLEAEVSACATTANIYTIGLRVQPKYPILRNGKDCGEVLLETHMLYNRYERNQIHGLAMAFSVGYRWEYIYFKAGYGLNIAAAIHMTQHSTENGIFEPHNLVYYLEAFARPHTSPWNISFCITDMTNVQMERMFTPIFILRSYVNVAEQWRLYFSGQCKTVGIANMAASFFGAEVKVGVSYRF